MKSIDCSPLIPNASMSAFAPVTDWVTSISKASRSAKASSAIPCKASSGISPKLCDTVTTACDISSKDSPKLLANIPFMTSSKPSASVFEMPILAAIVFVALSMSVERLMAAIPAATAAPATAVTPAAASPRPIVAALPAVLPNLPSDSSTLLNVPLASSLPSMTISKIVIPGCLGGF